MLRISCDETRQARFARVPFRRLLKGRVCLCRVVQGGKAAMPADCHLELHLDVGAAWPRRSHRRAEQHAHNSSRTRS
jgi:hypothetical protein